MVTGFEPNAAHHNAGIVKNKLLRIKTAAHVMCGRC